MLRSSSQIDVIGSDTRSDAVLELWGLGKSLRGDVRWPEWLRDYDVRVDQFFLQFTGRPILV